MCMVLHVCVFVWDLDSPIRKEGLRLTDVTFAHSGLNHT